jgi:hyperosmotically inducible protein
MARTGRVTRQAAQETTPAIPNGTADARTTIAIKGKLVADPDLSASRLSVNTTRGVVTLSGTVSSEANIGKAMLLALQTEGVQEVISTLQVKSM